MTLSKTQTKKTPKPARRLSPYTGFRNNWQLYIMLLPAIAYYVIFDYLPMYGIQIAFKDYRAVDGIWGSKWVGFQHFLKFFDAYYFERLIKNTFLLNIYGLVCLFPIPIALAIMLNRIRNAKVKKFIQTTIYLPHFVSTVVVVGMVYIFLSPRGGLFNTVRQSFGLKALDFMSMPSAFRTISVASNIWQDAGFSSILFIATLAGIDPALYEAAELDGASIWQKIRYIDIPTLIPTAMMVLIMNCGSLFASNASKVLLLQTPGNVTVSEIIGTYVHNVGLGKGMFSYTTAIGLFTNVVNLIMILTVNKISKKAANVEMF